MIDLHVSKGCVSAAHNTPEAIEPAATPAVGEALLHEVLGARARVELRVRGRERRLVPAGLEHHPDRLGRRLR